MSSEFAICVQSVSKCYHIYEAPHHRLLQMLTGGRRQLGREFWALRDISFNVKRGETVGIIGKNGSGKSTLLQLICGTLTPTRGAISIHGRVAALLELGAGFNPEFTGKENIFLNGALLGMTHDEISNCYREIVDFADIGDFIHQPVKTYSSGMIVRLAFAVQAQIAPDVLIVDEALAVGDARFQAKCFNRLNQLRERGTSILLVSHSSEQIVSHCSRAILLDNGCLIDQGDPRSIVNRYLDLLFGRERKVVQARSPVLDASLEVSPKPALSEGDDLFGTRPGYNEHEYRWGNGSARILDFYIISNGVPYPPTFASGDHLTIGISIRFYEPVLFPILGITIKTKEGVTVYGTNSELLNCREIFKSEAENHSINIEASFQCTLSAGDYFVSVGLANRDGEDVIPLDRRYDSIHLKVISPRPCLGLVDMGLALKLL